MSVSTLAELSEATAAHGYNRACWGWGALTAGTPDGKPRKCSECDKPARLRFPDGWYCAVCAYNRHLRWCPQ